MAALSQRRSEQANSASGASAATAKGPLLSPGLSSTQSDRSGVSLGSNGAEDGLDDRDAELTDPFDELQAFFAGASLTDGPSSDGRKPTSLKVRRRFSLCSGHGSLLVLLLFQYDMSKVITGTEGFRPLAHLYHRQSLAQISTVPTDRLVHWFVVCLAFSVLFILIVFFVHFMCFFGLFCGDSFFFPVFAIFWCPREIRQSSIHSLGSFGFMYGTVVVRCRPSSSTRKNKTRPDDDSC